MNSISTAPQVSPSPLTLSPVSNRAITEDQRKVVSSLNLIRTCKYRRRATVLLATVAAVAIVCLCCAAFCPLVCLVLLAIVAAVSLHVLFSVVAFMLTNFCREDNYCRHLAWKIRNANEENSNIPYASLYEWLLNPFRTSKAFLANAPAVRAFASLVNQEDLCALEILKRFTCDEQEYILNCDNLDDARLKKNGDTSDGIELEDISDGDGKEQIS
jgi:hypothetical protein